MAEGYPLSLQRPWATAMAFKKLKLRGLYANAKPSAIGSEYSTKYSTKYS